MKNLTDLENFTKNGAPTEAVKITGAQIAETKTAPLSLATVTAEIKALEQGCKRVTTDLLDIKGIDNEDEAATAANIIKSGRQMLKAVQDVRMQATRPLDEAKKALMSVEKELIVPIESAIEILQKKVNKYNAAQEQKRLEELAKIEKEKSIRIELETARMTTENKLEKLVRETLTRLQNTMLDELNKATDIEAVNKIENRLTNWKPKLSEQLYDSCFTHNFTAEAKKQWLPISMELSLKFPPAFLSMEYEIQASSAITFFKSVNIPERKKYVIELANKSAREQQEQLERDKLVRESRARMEAQQKAESDAKAKADAELKARTDAEMSAQAQQQAAGTHNQKRVKYIGVVEAAQSVQLEVLRVAVANGYKATALQEQVQKAADFLANGARPHVNGLSYVIE